jgi:hypothetical protein
MPGLVSMPSAGKRRKRGSPFTSCVSQRNAFQENWWKSQLFGLPGKPAASCSGVLLCGNQVAGAVQGACCAVAGTLMAQHATSTARASSRIAPSIMTGRRPTRRRRGQNNVW